MKIKFKLKNKNLEIREIQECKGVKKAIGLMFSNQQKASALLFNFKNTTQTSIHSFFCPYFLAIWLKDSRVVDYEIVKRWRFYIKPSSEFNALIEVPLNKKYKSIIDFFDNTTNPSVKT